MKKIAKFGELNIIEEGESTKTNNMKNGVFTIKIDGEIGWETTAEGVNEQLETAGGQDVVIEVSSPGGSVMEGVLIFNAIRNYSGNIQTRITGLAASIASYIALATKKVSAEDNAIFMIHNASGIVAGDYKEMQSQAEILKSINKLIAQEYINKTGQTEKKVLDLMDNETWLFGDEIKTAGFIDEIITHDNKENVKNKETRLTEAKNRYKNTLNKNKKEKKVELIAKVSKFEEDTIDKIKSIVDALKKQAKDKKPDEELKLTVKDVSLLIDDLENIIEFESNKAEEEEKLEKVEEKESEKKKTDETKKEGEEVKEPEAEPKEKGDKPETETKEEVKEETETKEKPEEKKEGEAEDSEESKFQALLEVCEGYKSELEKNQAMISKLQEDNEMLTDNNEKYARQFSKFEEEQYNHKLNDVVNKVSKFKRLNETQKLTLKKQYIESKMSDTALEEIGRMADDKMFSKLQTEPKVMTQPSQMLDGAEQPTEATPTDYSKMSQEEQLEALANLNAKHNGFVE